MTDERTGMTDRYEHSPTVGASRRAILLGAGGLGTAAILAACAAGGTDTPIAAGTQPGPDRSATDPATAPTTTAPTTTAPSPATADRQPPPGAIKTTDVPVGSGVIIKSKNVVVTQPTEGTFKAFTATCTHMGCQLASVGGGTINCNCHGSQYSVLDGSVKRGPATRSLAEKAIHVADGVVSV